MSSPGTFDAELADLIATGLRVGTSRDAEGEPVRTPAERRADALADTLRFFLDHQTTRPGGRHRPHVNTIVDLDKRVAGDPAAGRTAEGITLSAETISRLLCDCGVHRVVTRGRSTIVDYGTRTQTIPAPLFNALVIRDRHCRWHGCDRPASWCDGHHVTHWEHGGPTRLDNLVLLCRRHHTGAHPRVARQAPPRRHPRGHHPRRSRPPEPTTTKVLTPLQQRAEGGDEGPERTDRAAFGQVLVLRPADAAQGLPRDVRQHHCPARRAGSTVAVLGRRNALVPPCSSRGTRGKALERDLVTIWTASGSGLPWTLLPSSSAACRSSPRRGRGRFECS